MHHIAWLQAHPERTVDWFLDQIADGFDVHHVDTNHSNNAPDNLVLIEMRDHLKLHRIMREADPDRTRFDRVAYQREYMRKRRAATQER